MKKVMLFVAVAGFFAMTSCKKDYTCECSQDGFSYSYLMKETKKSAAAAVCEGEGVGDVVALDEDGNEVEGGSMDMDTGCSLK